MFLLVGLGNPGARYERTRHNVGFDVVELLADLHGIRIADKRFRARLGSGRIGEHKVWCVLPQTFMNVSGDSVGPMRGFYKVGLDEIVVVHDDLDLPFGAVKVKQGGGHGGHNGLRDLVKKLGGNGFVRVRVGVGRPEGPMGPADWVLARWTPEQGKEVPQILERAADAVEAVLELGTKEAMNRVNGVDRMARKTRTRNSGSDEPRENG